MVFVGFALFIDAFMFLGKGKSFFVQRFFKVGTLMQ